MAEEKGFFENILGDNMVDQFQRGLVSILGGGSLLGTSMNEYDEAYQQGIESGMTPEEILDLLGPRPELMGKANGGRVGLQTGGDTNPSYQDILAQIQGSMDNMEQTQMTLPSPQMQALQGVMGPMMANQLGTPIDTSQFAPSASAQTGLQQAAAQLAGTQAGLGTLQFDPTSGQFTGFQGATASQPYGADATGIAGYQQFLDQAATDINAASAAAAAGQGAGAGALGQAGTAMDAAQQAAFAGQDAGAQFMGPQGYQQFMSPYQQDVVDTTLASYDQSMAEQQAQLGANAGSAFGGGRFGVAQGQLGAQGAIDRAQAQANMLNQGYLQSNQLAAGAAGQAMQQASQNVNLLGQAAQGQMGLAGAQQGAAAQNANLFGTAGQLQQGLAALQPQLAQQTFASLGQVGTGQQAQIQAGIDTANQAAQMAAYEPQQRLGFFGSNLGAMQGGQSTFMPPQAAPSTSPMSNLLMGIGSGMSIGNMFGGWGSG
jgi:hypothetical protein